MKHELEVRVEVFYTHNHLVRSVFVNVRSRVCYRRPMNSIEMVFTAT